MAILLSVSAAGGKQLDGLKMTIYQNYRRFIRKLSEKARLESRSKIASNRPKNRKFEPLPAGQGIVKKSYFFLLV